MVAPQSREFGTLPAELIDQRFHVLRRPGPRDVRAERAHHEPGDALPIRLLDADVRIEEHETEQVTLLGSEGSVVDQHRRGGTVPRDNVPRGSLHIGRADLQRIEHALQSCRHTLGRLVMDLGRPAQGKEEEVLALDVREHQRARDAVDHVSRGRAAAPLLEPGVPRRADVGAVRHFFAPESRRAPPFQGEAERRRIELPAAVLQVSAQQVLVRGRHTPPSNHYTSITSLLYLDSKSIDTALQTTTWS